jgi:hypothetical protein
MRLEKVFKPNQSAFFDFFIIEQVIKSLQRYQAVSLMHSYMSIFIILTKWDNAENGVN